MSSPVGKDESHTVLTDLTRLAVVLLLASTAMPAVAVPAPQEQDQDRAVGLLVGETVFPFGRKGSGGFLLAAHVDLPLARHFLADAGVRVVPAELFFGQTGNPVYISPELSLQAQLIAGLWRPYVGGGIGFAVPTSSDRSTRFTTHLAIGFRVDAWARVGLRGELRARQYRNDEHGGDTGSVEWLLGLTYRF